MTIPSSLVSIGPGAFQDFTRLKGMHIPGSVTSIGGKVRALCDSDAS